MKFKDFEIRPTCFLDGHTDPKRFDVVKWYKTDELVKVTDAKTGEEKLKDTFCYSVAKIWWNEKEPCWEFKSVGTRFLKDYQEGLCEFILKWIELTDLTRKFTEEGITMDVREKLVELLGEVQETGVNEIPAGFGCTREYVKNEKVASHLIAHGVTVQEIGYVVTKTDRWATYHHHCSICDEELEWKAYPNFCSNCGSILKPQPPEGE